MKITAVSMAYRRAPIEIRQKVSFTKKEQKALLRQISKNAEVVIISTCNRSEIYTASNRDIKDEIIDIFNEKAKCDTEQYLDIYEDSEAISHLFLTASGLDSMIIGEDQILGQVKDAFFLAQEEKSAKKILNLIFRYAITAAKRVKTDTLLSKTPVSAASIAVKECESYVGADNKTALIIGATGKMGSVLLKDLTYKRDIKVYATYGRKRECAQGCEMIEYADRYKYTDRADIIAAATSSPHYVLTNEELKKSLVTKKKRIFIDLAVPRDIEFIPGAEERLINIDDLLDLSVDNNNKKLIEANKAKTILEKYKNELKNRLIFELYKDGVTVDMKTVFAARDSLSPKAFFEYIKEISR